MGRSRALFFSLLALAACEDRPGLPAGECLVRVWAQSEGGSDALTVIGDWDDWEVARPLRRFDLQWYLAEFGLPPGEYGYLVVEAGAGRVDPYNGSGTFRASDGKEVSLLRVADCSQPALWVADARELPDGRIEVDLRFAPAADGAPLDEASIRAEEAAIVVGAVARADPEVPDGQSIRVEVPAPGPGKHRLTIAAADRDGRSTAPARAVIWSQRRAAKPSDRIVYQVMIDRFRGPGGAALDPPPHPGARAGGTLDGVRSAIDDGWFDRLGVTTLWLSPVYVVPDEAREGVDGRLYEGYHGYWPLDARAVEPRLGGEAALEALVDAAHARGIDVVLDLVPNHLYETNPRIPELAASGGLHVADPLCVCGSAQCPWSTHIEHCWFTPYLPDLDHQSPPVLDMVIDDAAWWAERFDLDGFRIDAVPMMPRVVTRRIVEEIRRQAGPANSSFHLGEIFTGPGAQGTEVIRYYLGPDGLDSAFDFPLMWSLRDAVAHDRGGFGLVEATLLGTETAIEGSGSTMALIVGNHDVPRFMSEVVGQAGADPWSERPPEQPRQAEPYLRQRLALGLIMTLPGVPVIYYGDEVGLAGAGDPDNRRVMPAPQALLDEQVGLLEATRTLAVARRCFPALRSGRREATFVGTDGYVFVRDADDGAPVVVAASTRDEPSVLPVGGVVPSAGDYLDLVGGEPVPLGPAVTDLPMDAFGLRVLVAADHPCADLVR